MYLLYGFRDGTDFGERHLFNETVEAVVCKELAPSYLFLAFLAGDFGVFAVLNHVLHVFFFT